MNKSIVNIECAIRYKNKFLIIKRPEKKHAGGLLSFPVGKFEITDENSDSDILKNALIREIKEEVDLDIKDPIQYVTSSYFKDSITGMNAVNIVLL